MILQLGLLVLGFVILIKGADWLVDGGSALARKFHISELAIGLTIVAFGTSMPEMVVNVFASSQGHNEIAYGNIIGSNNFNLFVILGITGIISPLVVQSSTVWKEIPISLFAAVLLFFLSNQFLGNDPLLSRIDGLILLIFFILFLYYVFVQLKSQNNPEALNEKLFSNSKIGLLLLIGLVFLILGGKLVVMSAVEIAESLGVSQKVIGLTIVAIGTSLPELATSIAAAVKKNNDIAVGNIIGSNIFNIFFIIGLSAVIKPIEYDPVFNFDFYLLGIGTLLLFAAMFSGQKKKLDRWEAGILLLIYILYSIHLFYKS